MEALQKISEVAKQLNCSAQHVRRLVNDGEITVISLSSTPKSDRIERSELERYIERKRCTRTNPCHFKNETKPTMSAFAMAEKKLSELLAQPGRPKQITD